MNEDVFFLDSQNDMMQKENLSSEMRGRSVVWQNLIVMSLSREQHHAMVVLFFKFQFHMYSENLQRVCSESCIIPLSLRLLRLGGFSHEVWMSYDAFLLCGGCG